VLTTPNLALKKPEANDTVNIADLNYNADVLDQEVVKRLVNSGGVPSIQAGPDASKPAPGTAGRLYVATDTQIIYRDTGSAWTKVGAVKWGDIDGKPSSFTPSAHKTTHATGGADALAPADIGAASAADLAAHLADKANPHQVTAAQTGALVSVDGVSNAGGNIDLVAGANIAITPDDTNNRITIGGTGTWPNADTVDGAHAGTGANNVLKLDASGLVPLGNIPAILTGKSADKVDNIHFQIYNGVLQYDDDGTGWKDVALIATKPGIADINLSSASANTWYIVVNITGKGVLYRIKGSTGQGSKYLQIRVTLDGVSYTLSSGYTGRLIGDGLGFEVMMHIKFASSLKVEVQHTYSSSTALNGVVDYGLL
jgi:hypothetical protein